MSKYKEKKKKSIFTANNINSNDISIKIKFFLLKKIPTEPIKNNTIDVIKYISNIYMYYKLTHIYSCGIVKIKIIHIDTWKSSTLLCLSYITFYVQEISFRRF